MTNKRGKSPFFTDEEFLAGLQEVHQEQDIKQEAKQEAKQEVTQEDEQEVEQEANIGKVETVGIIGSPVIRFGATQGRKGLKLPRINMGFSPENHDWLRLRSRQRGMTITEFVNEILDRERLKE